MAAHRHEASQGARGEWENGFPPRPWLILVLWVAVGLVYWIQTYYTLSSRAPDYGWRQALADTWPGWLLWLLIAPLIAVLDRSWLMARPLPGRLLGHVLLCLPVTALHVALSLGLDRLRGVLAAVDPAAQILYRFQWNLTNYWVLAGLLMVLSLDRQVVHQRLRVAELDRELAEARLHSLAERVRPHFLFNSLNTIAAVLEREPALARRLIADLADNLRSSLATEASSSGHLAPCAEELALVDRYLSLEQARLGERLQLERRLGPGVEEVRVPPFSIQVLLENAIRHAVEPHAEPTHVTLTARREGGDLVVEVSDDGPGLGSGTGGGTGTGLDNLRRRLDALFGERAALVLAPSFSGGVCAQMRLPAEEDDG